LGSLLSPEADGHLIVAILVHLIFHACLVETTLHEKILGICGMWNSKTAKAYRGTQSVYPALRGQSHVFSPPKLAEHQVRESNFRFKPISERTWRAQADQDAD
jgi:hypothetical protein